MVNTNNQIDDFCEINDSKNNESMQIINDVSMKKVASKPSGVKKPSGKAKNGVRDYIKSRKGNRRGNS